MPRGETDMQQLEQAIRNYLQNVVFPLIEHPEAAEIQARANEDEGQIRFRLLLEAAGEKAGVKVVVHIVSKEEAGT